MSGISSPWNDYDVFNACRRSDNPAYVASQRRIAGVLRVETRSGGLPQFDPIALEIGDPAESTDTLHVLRLFSHVCSLGAQLREHRVQVADPEVEHGLLGAGPEVVGLGLERREHRQPGLLTPQAVLIGVQAQAIAIPRAQGRRVGGPQEVSADSNHTFHAVILPGRRWGLPSPPNVARSRALNSGRPQLIKQRSPSRSRLTGGRNGT